MRALVVISILMVVVVAGCDPGGLRRVRLRLPEPPDNSGTLVVHQPDVQEALRILDGVVAPLGFEPIPDQPTNTYIRFGGERRSRVTASSRRDFLTANLR